jgi:hypothetical protein
MSGDMLIAGDEGWLVGNGSRGDVKIVGKEAELWREENETSFRPR